MPLWFHWPNYKYKEKIFFLKFQIKFFDGLHLMDLCNWFACNEKRIAGDGLNETNFGSQNSEYWIDVKNRNCMYDNHGIKNSNGRTLYDKNRFVQHKIFFSFKWIRVYKFFIENQKIHFSWLEYQFKYVQKIVNLI